jgi:acetyl esterase/lipase
MVISLLVTLRDQGIPLPAGAVLISPWVDLTHSFPSLTSENHLDYIPRAGFHHKPSRAWPPPNKDDLARMREEIKRRRAGEKTSSLGARGQEQVGGKSTQDPQIGRQDASYESAPQDLLSADEAVELLSVIIDGKQELLKDQIQVGTLYLMKIFSRN